MTQGKRQHAEIVVFKTRIKGRELCVWGALSHTGAWALVLVEEHSGPNVHWLAGGRRGIAELSVFLAAFVLLLAGLGAGRAAAQVVNGDFAAGATGWTSTVPANSVLSFAGGQLTTVSDDDGGANSRTFASQTLTAADPGFLTALLVNWSTADYGEFDYPTVSVGGTYFWITPAGGLSATATGSIDNDSAPLANLTVRTTFVAGSQTIGFGVTATDSCCGAGTAVWDNIDFQELTRSPGAQAVDEDNALALSGGNALQVATNSGAASMSVSLSVANGILTLASTAGITVTSGANGSANMTFSGSPAAINAALDGLIYTPAADYNGGETLAFSVSGGGLSDTDTVAITVNAVPDYGLTISKTADVANVAAAGAAIGYTITVTNTGDTALTGISVSDTLDQNGAATALSLSGPGGDGGVTGVMEPGEVWVYTASHTVTQDQMDDAGDLVNTVVFDPAEMPVASDSATTTISANPSLAVTKAASDTVNVSVGQVITYTYTITNTGNQTISAIKLSDSHDGSGPAPAPDPDTATLTDNAPTGDSNNDTTGDGEWDALAPGDVLTVTGTYTVTQTDMDTLQ